MRIIVAVLGKFCINASFSTIYVFSTELLPTVIRFDIVIYWLKISVNRHPISRSVRRLLEKHPLPFSLFPYPLPLSTPATQARRVPDCWAAGTKKPSFSAPPLNKKPRSLIMISLIQTLFQFRLSHHLIRWWREAVSIVSLILTHPLAAVEGELAALRFFTLSHPQYPELEPLSTWQWTVPQESATQ